MSGIRILDELSRELKSERKTLKVPTNWLDRLRSKKGFPTGDSPDLGTFLSSQANTTPQIPRFHENCQTLPLRRRPRKQAHPTKVVRVCPPSTSTSTAVVAGAVAVPVAADEEAAVDPAAVADEEEAEDGAADGDDHDEGGPQVPMVRGPPGFPIARIQIVVQEEEEEEEELDDEEEEEEELDDEEEEEEEELDDEEEEEEELDDEGDVSTITEESVISG